MGDDRWTQVCALFEEARLATPAQRDALLAAQPALRAEVEELLRHHEAADAPLATQATEGLGGQDLVGQAVGGYRLLRLLGHGGMGEVYLAEREGRRYALKRMHPHLRAQASIWARFEQEAALGARIEHPGVVRSYGLVAESALLMEFVEGQTLDALLEEQGQVSEQLCRHIALALAQALDAIHRDGVVHRDLKPANVIITPAHEVKVMDFGIALSLGDQLRLSQTGQFIGTVLYGAPEQLRGLAEEIDGRADLYALGLILYELASGRHPIPSGDLIEMMRAHTEGTPRRLGELVPQCTPFFEELVHALLAKDPAERLPDAAALAETLAQGEESPWWIERAHAIRAETHRALRRIRVERESAVYGRDEELERLRAVFTSVQAGHGQVVLLEGEAGVGKTRLIDEFTRQLHEATIEFDILFGAHPPGSAATAVGALRQAFVEHLGLDDLEATLARHLRGTPALVPGFAALLRGDAVPSLEHALDPAALQTAFIDLTRVLAARRPLVLVVDDLHFAPDGGRALFMSLANAVVQHPILLIGTSRLGLDETWTADLEGLAHASRLAVPRLGARDLHALLRDVLASDQLAETLGWRVARKSDGNPYFAFEILRTLREQGVIRRSERGTWESTGAFDEIEIPSSLVDLVKARLANLDEAEQEILDVAACAGPVFDGGVLAETLGMARIPLLRALGRLERTYRLVHAHGSAFRFDHHQVQEVVYGRMSPALRAEYHAALADTLAARYVDPAPEQATLLCRHFLRGHRYERALSYVDLAGRHLEQTADAASALELFDALLEAPGILDEEARYRLLIQRSPWMQRGGRLSQDLEAMQEVLEATASRADAEDWAEELWYEAVIHAAQGRGSGGQLEDARTLIREALARTPRVTRKNTIGKLHFVLGSTAWTLGDLEEAQRSAEASLAAMRAIDDTIGIGRGHHLLGLVCVRTGQFEEARVQFEHWLESARASGARSDEQQALGALAMLLSEAGRYEEAEVQIREWAAHSRERGMRDSFSLAIGQLASVSYALGRFSDARDHFETAIAQTEENGAPDSVAWRCAQQAGALAQLGQREAADAVMARAHALRREVDHPGLHAHVLGQAAQVAWVTQDWTAMAAHAEEALALFRTQSAKAYVGLVSGLLAVARWHLGDVETAVSAFEAQKEAADELALGKFQAHAAVGRAQVGAGTPADAEAVFAAHRDRLENELRLQLTWALHGLTGNARYLDEAQALVTARLAAAPEADRSAMRTGVPLHVEILGAASSSG